MSSISDLVETGGESSRVIALLPAVAILSYFVECFSAAENRISRDRELTADQEGVAVTNSTGMASALVKMHAFAGVWEGLRRAAAEALKQGRAFVNASKTYAEAVSKSATSDILDGIADAHLSHPTDSHPPLSIRLGALGVNVQNVSVTALDVRPTSPAIDLLPDAEKVEEDISSAYQVILARQLGIELESGSGAPQGGRTYQSRSTESAPCTITTGVFTYMCASCHSFQRSDVASCAKCGAENPHRTASGH